ncbi:MAG TPA: hypothetical protein DEB39_05170 [Planctomycetaceae bacterium]|nr:hypothetical protein [Planctomycetaceae bacterium]
MNIHTTTVPSQFTDLLALNPPRIGPDRYAHRVRFVPITGNPGLCAKIPVPNEGLLHSIAVRLENIPPSGELFLSVADPSLSYEAFFLYAFLTGIPVTTKGPAMWRKTELLGAAYSTVQGTLGRLFLVILDGPTEPVLADVALTVETG